MGDLASSLRTLGPMVWQAVDMVAKRCPYDLGPGAERIKLVGSIDASLSKSCGVPQINIVQRVRNLRAVLLLDCIADPTPNRAFNILDDFVESHSRSPYTSVVAPTPKPGTRS
jgi:hypothetical protein